MQGHKESYDARGPHGSRGGESQPLRGRGLEDEPAELHNQRDWTNAFGLLLLVEVTRRDQHMRRYRRAIIGPSPRKTRMEALALADAHQTCTVTLQDRCLVWTHGQLWNSNDDGPRILQAASWSFQGTCSERASSCHCR